MSPIDFGDFRARVESLYTPPLQAPATRTKMRAVLRTFGAMPDVTTTADLTTSNVAAWIASRHIAVRVNTLVGEMGYLAAACSLAVDEGWLERSPFASRRFRLRAEAPTGPRHHTLADLARVLEYLATRAAEGWPWDRLRVAAAVVAYTGLRRNEALRLRVEDVDLTAGVLRVLASRQAGGRLKTTRSAAPVPAPPALVDLLATWSPGSDWLVPNRSRSGPWVGGSPGTKPLDRLRQAGLDVGVEGLTWLSLRHSWATHAEVWGLGEAEIQRVLRHTRPLTQRGYRHVDLANLRAIGARVRIG